MVWRSAAGRGNSPRSRAEAVCAKEERARTRKELCNDTAGNPSDVQRSTTCAATNPATHRPRTNGGVDKPHPGELIVYKDLRWASNQERAFKQVSAIREGDQFSPRIRSRLDKQCRRFRSSAVSRGINGITRDDARTRFGRNALDPGSHDRRSSKPRRRSREPHEDVTQMSCCFEPQDFECANYLT